MANERKLDAGSASPLYKQLIVSLRAAIADGTYPAHSRIPSEQELCDAYQVSRVTVRKALAELTDEGLLERFQGKGTFVCIPRLRKDLRAVTSFSDNCRAIGCEPGTRVLQAQPIRADERTARELQCAEGDEVILIERLRLADDQPVMLEHDCFPAAYRWLLEEDLTGSLYSVLARHMVETGKASHEVSLCYAAAAEARRLGVEQGAALLRLDEVIYDQEGHPLHTSRQLIRGDRFTFRI